MKIRQAAVQGLFYPNSKALLEKQFQKILPQKITEGKALACIAAHAGLIYSGEIAAKSLVSLKKTESYIILCPNHTGQGSKISISDADCWKTALGESASNKALAESIAKKLPEAQIEEKAHLQEHSAEMQLLILQKVFEHKFKIVVVCIAEQDLQILQKLGKVLEELSKDFEFCIIASSDFTHFEPEESAEQKDKEAISFILHNNSLGFYDLVIEKDLSICGFAGITSLLEFCKEKKLKAKLLDYHSSAKVTKDKSNAVGYASIVWE